MSDYILEMKVSELRPNPINSTIYLDNPDALEELKNSIEQNGLLEPITITKSGLVVSGHRRLQALTELGYETCECRVTYFENTTIATIELNRYREKTTEEITREAEVLREEYSKFVKKGRPLKGEEKITKTETITDVSGSLNISTTKLKKLLSIKNYEPEFLKKIDQGIYSVEKAYQIVRKKHIIPKRMSDEKSYENKNFRSQMNRLIEKYNPPFDVIYQSFIKKYADTDGFDSFEIIKGQTGITSLDNIREENDFYPTPPEVTRAFLRHEKLEGSIWEPACGKGHISKEVEKMYGEIESTDLYDRGYGTSGIDFLESEKVVDTIITNPPFVRFTDFVVHAKKCARKKICLFGKTSYLEGSERYQKLWTDKKYPLKKIVQYVDRLTLKKNEIDERRRGMVSYCWYVFEMGYTGSPKIEWVRYGGPEK